MILASVVANASDSSDPKNVPCSNSLTPVEALTTPTLIRKGIHFSDDKATTTVFGTRFQITADDDGSVWREFDLGAPIDFIELVEYPAAQGIFMGSKTMAVVVSGRKLLTIDVQSEEPKIVSSVEAVDRITHLTIGGVTYVNTSLGFGIQQTSPKADVQVHGVLGEFTFRLESAELTFHSGPQPLEVQRLANADLPQFERKGSKVLQDFQGLQVVQSNDALFLVNPTSEAQLFVTRLGENSKVTASRGILGDTPDVTTVSVDNKVFILNDKLGTVWNTFEVEDAVDAVQLVEIPVVKGILMGSDTFAFVQHGHKLSVFNVQQTPVVLASEAEFSAAVEGIRYSRNKEIVKLKTDDSGGIGMQVISSFVDVSLANSGEPIRFRVNAGKLEMYQISGTADPTNSLPSPVLRITAPESEGEK
jgi:hypothetical protein